MAAFTAILAYVTVAQSKQIEREFVWNHRPRLQVGQFKLQHDTIAFYIVNVGDSRATIIGSSLKTRWWHVGQRPAPDYSLGLDGVPHFDLAPGNTFQVAYSAGDPTPTPILLLGSDSLHAFGLIRYTDQAGGIQRFTAFCRWWNPNAGRFELTNDPDYEFND